MLASKCLINKYYDGGEGVGSVDDYDKNGNDDNDDAGV